MLFISFFSFKRTLLLTTLFAINSVQAMEREEDLFSTRPSEEFTKIYGTAANRKFHEMVPQVVGEVCEFVRKQAHHPDAAKIEDLVNFVGKKRSEIAKKAKSIDASHFGKSRRFKNGYRGCGDLTPLYPLTYPHWRGQLSHHLDPLLKQMLEKNEESHDLVYSRSKLNITIKPVSEYDLTHFERNSFQVNPTVDQLQKLADHSAVFDESAAGINHSVLGEAAANKRHQEMADRFDDMTVVKATFSLKLGEKFVPTSSVFMSYLKEGSSIHPQGLTPEILAEMMDKGAMIYQHTLQAHLPSIENALGQYYKLILKWKAKEEKTQSDNNRSLLTLLSGFHYIFDHLMPYQRGSGAGAEWATRALARLKGYDLTLGNDAISVVQEDLSQPNLVAFGEWYKSNVNLKKI